MATTKSVQASGRRDSPQEPGPRASDVEPLAEVAERSTKRHSGTVGLVLGIILAASAALLIVQNTQTVPVHWLWFDADAPMWLIITVALAVGLIGGPLIVAGIRYSRRRRRERLGVIETVRRR
jgi:uncharacterized integral membrane protein